MEEDIKLINEMIENCRNKKEYYDEKAERKAIVLENVLKELELAKKALKDKCDIADERNQLLVEKQKKDNTIKSLENRNRKLDMENQKLFEQSLFQDKVIDEMSEFISGIDIDESVCSKIDVYDCALNEECKNCKECIKQFFIKKVEEQE